MEAWEVEDPGRALNVAWLTEVGDLLEDRTVERLLAVGWVPADLRRAVALAWYVQATGSAYLMMTSRPRLPKIGHTALDLVHVAAGLMEYGVPRADAFGWVEVFACCPRQDLLNDLIGIGSRWRAPEVLRVEDWSREVGALGSLVFAAGLSLDEAVARRDAGDLDAETLRMLVGLRGWRLPPGLPA